MAPAAVPVDFTATLCARRIAVNGITIVVPPERGAKLIDRALNRFSIWSGGLKDDWRDAPTSGLS